MSGRSFEEDVRGLARARWNLPPGEGGSVNINGQEVDIRCDTEDVTHLIMCTVSRRIDKIRTDVEKLGKAARFLQGQGVTTKTWIITQEEPTADQREIAKKAHVQALSYAEFRRSLIDVPQYFSRRAEYRFGSAVDPVTASQRLAKNEYIPAPITDVRTGEQYSVKSLVRKLEEGAVIALTGEFGAGKSLTVREVFYELQRRYHTADKYVVPIPINLREHWGQTDVAEVLTRHAQRVAYSRPSDLVRAWNAGNCAALLDGFDELAIQSLASHHRTKKMARHAATQVVREFVASARGQAGVLITGRSHYFDSQDEMRSALGLTSTDPILELSPFTEKQAEEYLRRKGVAAHLPDWLPRSPLLLGYLAAKRLLRDVSEIEVESAAEAWNIFLDKITTRDAALGPDIDPYTVRRLLERLATKTRLAVGGGRELDDADVGQAFREVTGATAVDATHVLLQRLPGLTAETSEEGTRSFIDSEMIEALRASDELHYLQNPYSPFVDGQLQHPLTEFACGMLSYLAEKQQVAQSQYIVAAREAVQRWSEGTLALDCLIAGAMSNEPNPLPSEGLILTDGLADVIDLEAFGFSDLTLNSCAVNTLRLGSVSGKNLRIENCLISRVEGASSEAGLPGWMTGTTVETFDPAGTTAALLELDLPVPVRISLTVLKKIFVQSGSGRREGALRRGLDLQVRHYVDPVLEVLRSHGFIWRSTTGGQAIWHGNPEYRSRATKILAAPMASGDPVIPALVSIEP